MATIKIFDSHGVKTLVMLGNANEQAYDVIEEEELDEVINQIAEATEDGF